MESGAQPGNKNATKNKPITDAIIKALHEECEVAGKTTKKMYALAGKLVDQAVEGNLSAAREVLDRVEGRANQSVSIEPGESLLAILDELEQRRELKEIEGEVIDNDPQLNGDNSADAMLIEHDGDTAAQ